MRLNGPTGCRTAIEPARMYKDDRPESTVARIRSVLADINVTMTGDIRCPSPGLYAMSLRDNEHGWSVNGKGLSEAYCLASAYGEAVERLGSHWVMHNGLEDISDRYGFSFYPDEARVRVRDIKARAGAVYGDMLRAWRKGMPNDETLWALWERVLGGTETAFAPYFDLRAGRVAALPDRVIAALCGSNGLCSGNTPEEALCQGFSEVLERYAVREIVSNGLTPPQIPRKWLETACPALCGRIKRIEESFGYVVRVFDASLGKGCPVVCVALIDRAKQRYCLRFGAHFALSTALERCLTELVQGFSPGNKRMEDAYMRPYPAGKEFAPDSVSNLYGMMRVGICRVSDRFFAEAPDWPFVPWGCGGFEDNRRGLRSLIDALMSIAPEIYVRDQSYLGLPVYRVYAPLVSPTPFEAWNDQTFEYFALYQRLVTLPFCPKPLGKEERGALLGFLEDSDTYYPLAAQYCGKLPVRLEAIHAALLADAGDTAAAAQLLEMLGQSDAKYMCAARELQWRERPAAERDRALGVFFNEAELAYVNLVWRQGSAVENLFSLSSVSGRSPKRNDALLALYSRIKAKIAGVKIDQMQLKALLNYGLQR